MKYKLLPIAILGFLCNHVNAQNLPSSIVMKDIAGGTFTMGSNNLTGSPTQQASKLWIKISKLNNLIKFFKYRILFFFIKSSLSIKQINLQLI